MNKNQRIINSHIVSSDAITEAAPRTDAITRTLAIEWLALNDALTIEQSYEIQDEMAGLDSADKLMVVRNWAGRMATAASKRAELQKEIGKINAFPISSELPKGDRVLYRHILDKRIAEAQERIDAIGL